MEATDADLLKQFQKRVLGQSPDAQYEILQKQIDAYNGLCERADSLVQTLRKTAVIKRKRTDSDSGKNSKPSAVNEQQAKTLLYAAHTGVGLMK